MSRIILTGCILFTSLCIQAFDSSKVFTIDQLKWYIEEYHPVSKQAQLLSKQGESTLKSAKGAFDPLLFSSLDQKQFNGKQYYNILNSGLSVPTWFGIELGADYKRNNGVFLNPENNLPTNGLWSAGVSVPVGQGLLMDKRRAVLKQAKVFYQSTEAHRNRMMNNLYFEAIGQYWEWTAAWNQYQVYEESVRLAQERFDGIKRSFILGDVPAIDTLEAYILVQNRMMNRNQSFLLYQNATLELSNYLWYEGNIPLEITSSLTPPDSDELKNLPHVTLDSLQISLQNIIETHPEMQLYKYELNHLDIEQKLKKEGLKPQLDFNYNFINEPVGANVFDDITLQNYKWGFDFSFPIFIRKARGDLQLTRLKIQETQLKQGQELLKLQNKVKQYYNEQINLKNQVELYTDAVENYSTLTNAERQKFDLGESSVFLVNSRETKLITANLKLIELQSKYFKAYYGFQWAGGILYSE